MQELKNVMSTREAAFYLGCSEGTMRLWRSSAKGPRYFQASKLIRYRKSDLDAWIEARLSSPEAS